MTVGRSGRVASTAIDATSTTMSHEKLGAEQRDTDPRLEMEHPETEQKDEAKEVVSIPALSYPHLIDSIFASAPYASLLSLRAADKDFHQRASNILGSHLILSSRGSGRSSDPLRIEVSSYVYASRRTKRTRFTLTRASPTATSTRAKPLAEWLAKEALPETLDLNNWGKGRWWLPPSVRSGVEGLRPRTVRIYAASGSQMATWDRPTERTVVFAAIPPWSHEAVRVIPAPEVPDTRKMVVNLTVHERGRHLPLGELAAWDSLPDGLRELVIIVKDAEEKGKTFVPRPSTSHPVRHTAASLARTKAAQKTKAAGSGAGGVGGGGGGAGGDRATRQEWGVLHPLYSWLISAWRAGGIRALMRDDHAIRLTVVGMTEVRPNHAGFANSTTVEDRTVALEGYRRSIAEVWRSVSLLLLRC